MGSSLKYSVWTLLLAGSSTGLESTVQMSQDPIDNSYK
jgi:hypothetical protein